VSKNLTTSELPGKKSSPGESKFKYVALLVIASSMIVAAMIVMIYWFEFGNELASDKTSFAQFGDYIGGVLNPLLTFLTVVLLIFSISYQLDELGLTRQEITRQANAQEQNSSNQLAVAKRNEKIANLPILSDSLSKIYREFEAMLKTRVSYTTSQSDCFIVGQELIINPYESADDNSLVAELGDLSWYAIKEDLPHDSVYFEKSLEREVFKFLDKMLLVNDMLEAFERCGGETVVSFEIGRNVSFFCFFLSFSNNPQIKEQSDILLGQLHSYTRNYYKNTEQNQ